ncbi:MAG: hypothetical protein ACLP9L_15930 [Thermoguttaceae bacterium]
MRHYKCPICTCAHDSIEESPDQFEVCPLCERNQLIRMLKAAVEEVVDYLESAFNLHREDAREGLNPESDWGDLCNMLADVLDKVPGYVADRGMLPIKKEN